MKRCFDYFTNRMDTLGYIEQNGLDDKELLLSYLKHSKDVPQSCLKKVIELLPNDGKTIYEILTSIYDINKRNQATEQILGKICESVISSKLVLLTNAEILEIKHTEQELEDFISSFSFIIPHFIGLIKALNELFDGG